mmetsp:Transcript_29364/g.79495  ORF Transcript_29364/g.79495 Transcript_29364/m.79495 type:complete len:138 (-) Transcript_29364:103-516(-)
MNRTAGGRRASCKAFVYRGQQHSVRLLVQGTPANSESTAAANRVYSRENRQRIESTTTTTTTSAGKNSREESSPQQGTAKRRSIGDRSSSSSKNNSSRSSSDGLDRGREARQSYYYYSDKNKSNRIESNHQRIQGTY